jgi:hypothetical protein
MTWHLLLDYIDKLAWPIVVVVGLLAFRGKISSLIDRTREVEGPADLKIKLDPSQVERIVDEGKKEGAPAHVVAQRIIDRAVVDPRELRILRALIGEDEGRGIYSYQTSYYLPALEALLKKGLIAKRGNKFFLTQSGVSAAAEHVMPILSQKTEGKNHT